MKSSLSKVSVVGLGYIGLPTAAVLASRGIQVIGLEVNQSVVDTINQGKIHIVEPGLDIVVGAVVSQGNLRATRTAETADAYLIAVPTPFKGDDHEPDLSYVEAATLAIAPVLKKNDLVVLESTSPVGTTDQMAKLLQAVRPDLKIATEKNEACDVFMAYCPERVLPGNVLLELIENDRVIGGINKASAEKAKDLYKIFVNGKCIITNARTAEMVKLTENSFRDVNIAFANELSLLCDKLDVNVWELIGLANRHPRVKILQPGPGVGGHCISVDPWFLVHQNPEQAKLIHASRLVNDGKPEFVLAKIREAAGKLKNPKVAFLGLAFKANIDDLRESPAMQIVEKFVQEAAGVMISVVEPYIDSLPKSMTGLPLTKKNLVDAVKDSDIVVLLVDHNEFKDFDRSLLAEKIVIDTRGAWFTATLVTK